MVVDETEITLGKQADLLHIFGAELVSLISQYNMNFDIYWADDFLYIQKISIAYMK